MAGSWNVRLRFPGWVNIDAELSAGTPNPGQPGTYTVWVGEADQHANMRSGAVISGGSTTWIDDTANGLLLFDVKLLGNADGAISGMNVGIHVHVPDTATASTACTINSATSLGTGDGQTQDFPGTVEVAAV